MWGRWAPEWGMSYDKQTAKKLCNIADILGDSVWEIAARTYVIYDIIVVDCNIVFAMVSSLSNIRNKNIGTSTTIVIIWW